MPIERVEQELQEIREVISSLPDGGTIDEIAASLKLRPSTRTLQRRLAMLTHDGQILTTGKGRAVRYRLADRSAEQSEDQAAVPETFPLSGPAKSLQSSIRQPIQLRAPVGYNRSFLDGYRPNEVRYISEDLSRELIELGRFPDGEAPAGTYAREIYNRLLIDLSWNSSRLEGNTYSLLETERLLELGASADGKTVEDTQMILNHKAAIEMLVEEANEIRFNRHTILNLHGVLSDNLLPDPKASGRLRTSLIGIRGSVYHPLQVPQMIEECFSQILATAEAIVDPIEQAFFVLVHLPYLQPFLDVNKRVSRLATNIPLIRQNLCPLSFVEVPRHEYTEGLLAVYELNRIELARDVFVWAYRRSCERYAAVRQVIGEPDLFRLRYRLQLKKLVYEIVTGAMDKTTAITYIRKNAASIPVADRDHFIEVVETELLSLHEGNFARYRVRPSQFEAWLANWH